MQVSLLKYLVLHIYGSALAVVLIACSAILVSYRLFSQHLISLSSAMLSLCLLIDYYLAKYF